MVTSHRGSRVDAQVLENIHFIRAYLHVPAKILGLVCSDHRPNKAALIVFGCYCAQVIFFVFYRVLHLFFAFTYTTLITLL